MNSDGSGNGRIQLIGAEHSYPDWHPDGSTIIFHSLSSNNNRGDLWSIPSIGGAATNITNTAGYDEWEASYSSDGRWITFVSGKGGKQGIWIMPTGGGEVTLIVDYDTERIGGPRFSPDGTMIAFDLETPGAGDRNVWIVSGLIYP